MTSHLDVNAISQEGESVVDARVGAGAGDHRHAHRISLGTGRPSVRVAELILDGRASLNITALRPETFAPRAMSSR